MPHGQSHRTDSGEEITIIKGGEDTANHGDGSFGFGPYEEGPQQCYQNKGNSLVQKLPLGFQLLAKGDEDTVDQTPKQVVDAVP